PLMRGNQGFRPAAWDEALDFTARRLREVQEKFGKDAVAVYGGASLISEKSYLIGKFARVALGTRHIDYNGRLCMVSAGTAYKLALGIDRNPIRGLTSRTPTSSWSREPMSANVSPSPRIISGVCATTAGA